MFSPMVLQGFIYWSFMWCVGSEYEERPITPHKRQEETKGRDDKKSIKNMDFMRLQSLIYFYSLSF